MNFRGMVFLYKDVLYFLQWGFPISSVEATLEILILKRQKQEMMFYMLNKILVMMQMMIRVFEMRMAR